MPTGSSPWPLIHAERRALLADAEQLSREQWSTHSLCEAWTVRDVIAHLTATALMTPGRFASKMVAAGFHFQTMTARDIEEQNEGRPQDTLDRFRAQLDATTHPPGPVEAMIGEAVVHGEDFRRPLGIVRAYPMEALVRSADFFRSSNLLIGGKRRVAGLRLRATDADWSAGQGPEVSGPMLDLLLAITGRRAGLARLTGEGLPTLTSRR